MKKRNEAQIIHDILASLENESLSKIRLLARSGVTYEQSKKYFPIISEAGCLEIESLKYMRRPYKLHKITPLGRQVLNNLRNGACVRVDIEKTIKLPIDANAE